MNDLLPLGVAAAPEHAGPKARKRDTRSGPGTGLATTRNDHSKPLYVITAYELIRAVQSDDEGHGLLARRHAERVLVPLDPGSGPGQVQGCPDPVLFERMRQLGLDWAARHEFAGRRRLAGAVTSLAHEVMQAGRSPAPEVLPGILKGIPAHDR